MRRWLRHTLFREGVYTLRGGSLYVNASFVKYVVEGVVTGGIGRFAFATGTFASRDVKHGAETTVTLLKHRNVTEIFYYDGVAGCCSEGAGSSL